MEYIKRTEIDFSIIAGEKTVTVKQLDKQSRYLELVPQYNGDKIDIRDYTAKLYAERPDRKVIVQDCEINEEGNISVEITEEIAALDGTVRCDIKLYEDDAVFSCFLSLCCRVDHEKQHHLCLSEPGLCDLHQNQRQRRKLHSRVFRKVDFCIPKIGF